MEGTPKVTRFFSSLGPWKKNASIRENPKA